ncbi:MAG: hypothetical protein IT526_03435 [Nitrosomonas sp.]|uniref:hypothetical protein n=1 Tax=Nitrosomonas sp. TaxID=42353 RepID=UPI00255F7D07|nr:hypothetical protein [Nitrosomonas sp.]MCC6161284.1 hypothetical protein [Nitrosomonas sp.]MDL1866391.1 hypothetical protein [Betaproteobacteria bacterium PRO4]
MRNEFFLAIVLSLSVPCFAESKEDPSGSLIEVGQAENSQAQARQPAQIETADKENESQSSQESGLDKQSLMIDYCRTHTC